MYGFYETARDTMGRELTHFTLPLKFDNHFHESLEFIRCDQESLDVYLDNVCYTLYNGDFILIHSFTSHMILDTNLNTCYMIPIKYLSSYTQKVGAMQPTDPIIRREKAGDIEKILSLYSLAVLTKEPGQPSRRCEMASGGWSNLLAAKIIELVPFEPLPKKIFETRDILRKTVLYVNKHYREDISLSILAKHCGYSEAYYSSKINSIFNTNLTQYINTVRALKFKAHYDKTRSIEYQAEAVGFNSKQTFYRAFKSVFGCSPKEYFANKDI